MSHFIKMFGCSLALLFLLGCTDYELLSHEWCADKGGLKGWSTHMWQEQIVHCNNGDSHMVGTLQ